MEHIRFKQVTSADSTGCACFRELMHAYCDELGGMDEFAGDMDADVFLEKWIQSILKLQGPSDRHLELCWMGDIPVGFLYGKVDHKEHRGFVKPGYGYVMEFYVVPDWRRRGIGTQMFRHLERSFAADGAERMYLTTDTECGIPFWKHLGFVQTNER